MKPEDIKPGIAVWIPKHHAELRTRPCKICRGYKKVWVCNIEHDEFEVECEACGKGYEGPTGTEDYYDYTPGAEELTVKAITKIEFAKVGDGSIAEVQFVCTNGRTIYGANYAYATHAEALQVSVEHIEATYQSDGRRSKSSQYYKAKNAAWQARYHQDILNDFKRRSEYHLRKLSDIKARSETPRRAKTKNAIILTERN